MGSTTASEVANLVALARDPILQVGSRAAVVDTGEGSWRQLLAGRDFTGLDIEPGEGVDIVADIADDDLDRLAGRRRYRFIICQHVLEHVPRPFEAARNLTELLAPDGLLFVATPWVQSYHGYPRDYWRFSFDGLRALFGGLEPVDMYYSGTGSGFDAAYKLRVDGGVNLVRTPFEIESRLFEIAFAQDENMAVLRRQADQPKLPLARFYLPAIFVNLLLRKPVMSGAAGRDTPPTASP